MDKNIETQCKSNPLNLSFRLKINSFIAWRIRSTNWIFFFLFTLPWLQNTIKRHHNLICSILLSMHFNLFLWIRVLYFHDFTVSWPFFIQIERQRERNRIGESNTTASEFSPVLFLSHVVPGLELGPYEWESGVLYPVSYTSSPGILLASNTFPFLYPNLYHDFMTVHGDKQHKES